eukprot:1731255-Prymnesium_polylepis.1
MEARRAIRPSIAVKAPLREADLSLTKLVPDLLQTECTDHRVRVEHLDHRLPAGGAATKLADAILRLKIALRAEGENHHGALD